MSDKVKLTYAFFCEDLRTEVGNKITAVGLWGPVCIIQEFPAVLRSIAFHANISNPRQEKFEVTITIGVPNVAEPIVHVTRVDPASHVSSHNINLVIGPFPIDQPCTVTARLHVSVSPPIDEAIDLTFIKGTISK